MPVTDNIPPGQIEAEQHAGIRATDKPLSHDPELHCVCDRFNSGAEADLFAKYLPPGIKFEIRNLCLFLIDAPAPWVADIKAQATGWCTHRDELLLAWATVEALEGR